MIAVCVEQSHALIALDALSMRLRWYDTRRHTPPADLVAAFLALVDALDVDASDYRYVR